MFHFYLNGATHVVEARTFLKHLLEITLERVLVIVQRVSRTSAGAHLGRMRRHVSLKIPLVRKNSEQVTTNVG